MNGAGLGNIKFGDGLESYPEEEIKNGSFDILVANPPYSVSGFKMHLKVNSGKDYPSNYIYLKVFHLFCSKIRNNLE